MTSNKKIKKVKEVAVVEWIDAAFSDLKELPKFPPPPQVTVGIILENNNKFLKIGFNFSKINGELVADDGFIIPKKTITKIKKFKLN